MKAKKKAPKQLCRRVGILDRDMARTDASRAIELLRNLTGVASTDPSIHEFYPNRLSYELDLLEQTLSAMLPPPGSKHPILILSEDEEECASLL